MVVVALLLAATAAFAAAPGIKGPNFAIDGVARRTSPSPTDRWSIRGATAATAAVAAAPANIMRQVHLQQHDAGSRPDADRHRGTNRHGDLTNSLPARPATHRFCFLDSHVTATGGVHSAC